MDAGSADGTRRALEGRGWPLVGREDELALAMAAIRGSGSVVLTGAPGVGKTRLAHEVLERAGRRGARVEWIAATEAAATIPLGAVARLVPPDAVGGGRDATLGAIVAALANAKSAEGGLLLGVDDGHLLDEASAALVHLLLTSGAATAVVTVRQGERVPDAISRLWHDDVAPLVALQPLARAEVEQLVAGVLDGAADGALMAFLWEASRGNALFLRELMRDGVQSGALRHESGVWRWDGEFRPGQRLHDLVALRMGRLDDDERAALEFLAVGGPLSLDCVRLLGHEEAVARMERRGLVTSSWATREVHVAHPLFGEVTRAAIPLVRLDVIRRDLADAVEATSDMSPQLTMRVALWRAESGDRSHPAQLVRAARHAWVIGAAVVAERLARAALESGPHLEAGHLLGEALSDQGRPDEAIAAWQAVEHLSGPEYVLASIARGHAGVLAYQLNRVGEARDVFRRALDRITDENIRQGLLGTAAVLAVVHPEGASLAVEATTLAPAQASPLTPASALALATRLCGEGRLEAAVATIDNMLASASEWSEQEPAMAVLLGMTRVWALALNGQLVLARDDAEDAYARYLGHGVEQPRGR